jgi:hypothetical protein
MTPILYVVYFLTFVPDQVFLFLWPEVEPLGCQNIMQLCQDLFLEERKGVSLFVS